MGNGNRPPTVGELAKMRSLVWRAMADGAVGSRPASNTCPAPTR